MTEPPRISLADAAAPRLAVVVPALDEAATIAAVVAAVPRRIPGAGRVEVIVVDDGSRDGTPALAAAAGADLVVTHARSRGLAASFKDGVTAALRRGADVVVNLDGDGQHDPRHVPALVAPLVDGRADMVVGVRPLRDRSQGTPARRLGNRVGAWGMRRAVGTPVRDVTSGFRAYTREALLRLNVVSEYTYTLETLIQAERCRLAVAEVVVPARSRVAGESRMTHSLRRYIGRTGGQALRTLLHTRPLTAFGWASTAAGAIALLATGWFLLGYRDGGMHLPALLAAVLFAMASGGFLVCGLLADGINSNRRLLEDALHRLRSMEAAQAPVAAAPPVDQLPLVRPLAPVREAVPR